MPVISTKKDTIGKTLERKLIASIWGYVMFEETKSNWRYSNDNENLKSQVLREAIIQGNKDRADVEILTIDHKEGGKIFMTLTELFTA